MNSLWLIIHVKNVPNSYFKIIIWISKILQWLYVLKFKGHIICLNVFLDKREDNDSVLVQLLYIPSIMQWFVYGMNIAWIRVGFKIKWMSKNKFTTLVLQKLLRFLKTFFVYCNLKYYLFADFIKNLYIQLSDIMSSTNYIWRRQLSSVAFN